MYAKLMAAPEIKFKDLEAFMTSSEDPDRAAVPV